MSWQTPEPPVAVPTCAPCEDKFNPIRWDQKELRITAAAHLNFYLLTYVGNPTLEEVIVTIGPSVDDVGVVLGAFVLFQQRTSVPVRFVTESGITAVGAGELKPYQNGSIVGLISTAEDDWAFGGDFGFE